MEIREAGNRTALETLFYGSKRKKINTPLEIPGLHITVEGKTGNENKIRQLRALMEEMELDPHEFLLELRLAHRQETSGQ